MSIVLLVITDGRRDCITRTVASAAENLLGPITRRVIYDDSGDAQHRAWLNDAFNFEVISHPDGRQGFGGAIRAAWAYVARECRGERYVFHLEDDFTFNRAVNLRAMSNVLDAHPHITQLALRRQPWNELERQAGGVVEQHPDDYTERTDGRHVWLEHRRFWTSNPSLYRKDLLRKEWPTGQNSEGHFSIRLFEDPHLCSAFWGARDSGEAVEHIGHQRIGVGY